MTTFAVPGQAPRNNEEWALSVEQRLRAAASPPTARIGQWVLSDIDGELVAQRPGQSPISLSNLDAQLTGGTVTAVSDTAAQQVAASAAEQASGVGGELEQLLDTLAKLFGLSSGNKLLDTFGAGGITTILQDFISGKLNPLNLIELGGNSLTNIQELLGINPTQSPGTFNPADALIIAPVQQGFDIINGIVTGIKQVGGAFWTLSDATAALTGQAEATTANAAALAQLQAGASGSTTGGVVGYEDFSSEPDSTNLPATFTETYTTGTNGSWGVHTGRAATTANCTSGVRDVIGEYNVAQTVTDYQRIGMLCTSAPGRDYFNPTPFFLPLPFYGPYYGHNRIYGRYQDVNNWVAADFSGNDTVVLQTCVAGIVTTFATHSHAFQPGVGYYLECGTAGDLYTYRVMANSTALITYTDSAHVSQVGAAFRGGCLGAHMEAASGVGGPVNPGDVYSFILLDNALAGVPGVAARYYRAATGLVAVSSGIWGADTLDTTEYTSSGITFDPSTQTVSVATRGLYLITTAAKHTSNPGTLSLYKNAALVRDGSIGAAAWVLVLETTDTIQPGANAGSVGGSADGALTFLEITKIG